jgi:hypothetical protein
MLTKFSRFFLLSAAVPEFFGSVYGDTYDEQNAEGTVPAMDVLSGEEGKIPSSAEWIVEAALLAAGTADEWRAGCTVVRAGRMRRGSDLGFVSTQTIAGT